MCADSTHTKNQQTDGRVTLSGKVERRLIDKGSKSERHAMVLVLRNGKSYPLRRVGGNAMRDPYFEAMEGQTVSLTGRLRPGFFLVGA